MSALSALLGRIFNSGTELELGGGIDFGEGLDAAYNPTTKRVEVVASGSGTGIGIGGAPNARVRVLGAGMIGGGADDSHSGLAARDGVTLVDGDPVLDLWHSNAVLRGYWLAHSGAWTRPDYFDSDEDVAALFGTFTTIQEGTVGANPTPQAWRQIGGYTHLGGKLYEQVLGNPDVVQDENGGITELMLSEGTGTGFYYSGARNIKDITTTSIGAGLTVTVWTFDSTALGVPEHAQIDLAPNVNLDWATDDKHQWVVKAVLALQGASVPAIVGTKSQEAIDETGSGTGVAWSTLAWDAVGGVIRLRVTNNRATACTVTVTTNFIAVQVRP